MGWLHTGLGLIGGGLHGILGLVVGSAGPHVNLAGVGGLGQYSYGVHLTVLRHCPALEVRHGIFRELNLPNLVD